MTTLSPRLPAESVAVTCDGETYTVTLDANRMPTHKGCGGVVADRSRTRGVMKDPTKLPLFQAYMLAHLRDPLWQGHTEADFPKYDRWALSLVDNAHFAQFGSMAAYAERKDHRYSIELWSTALVLTDTGNPEQDVAWGAGGPVLCFAVPSTFSLQDARVMTEALAWLLAHGRYHPSFQHRSPAAVMRQQTHMQTIWRPAFDAASRRDPRAVRRLNFSKGQQLSNWIDARPARRTRQVLRFMLKAVEADRKRRVPAEKAQWRQTRLARALTCLNRQVKS